MQTGYSFLVIMMGGVIIIYVTTQPKDGNMKMTWHIQYQNLELNLLKTEIRRVYLKLLKEHFKEEKEQISMHILIP